MSRPDITSSEFLRAIEDLRDIYQSSPVKRNTPAVNYLLNYLQANVDDVADCYADSDDELTKATT